MTSPEPVGSSSPPKVDRPACMVISIFGVVVCFLAVVCILVLACGLWGGLLFMQLPPWIVTRTPTPEVAASEVPPSHRILFAGNFFVTWSQNNPEEITELNWKRSANLTNRYANSECPSDLEYFGNSWVSENEGTPSFFFGSLVGYGTQGTWNFQGATEINIESMSVGCPKSAGIQVHTFYHFFEDQTRANLIIVKRTFDFGNTPYAHDIRPFVPRLYPRDHFNQILHPNAIGDELVTHTIAGCGYGCRISDWDGTWFAIHDPQTGIGMLVQHVQTDTPVALWIDEDGGSFTNSSSVLLLRPSGGFTGSVTEIEYLCFYDTSIWSPSLTLPPGCQP